MIFLGDFSFVIIFLKNYRVTMTTTLNTFGKYNGFVSKARVSACMYFLVVAVKLFSILMNLGKIVLQVGCSDKIIQPISSTVHSFVILVSISKQKHLC